jgi:hypothetical protein
MFGLEIDGSSNLTGQDVIEAHRKRLKDAADVGFAVSQEEAPQDRGQLQQSGFPPEFRDGDVVFGYTAPYAEPMEKGTQPFQPPIQPLLEWSRRVSGGESLGWYVATVKIPREGIDAQPYLRPGAERAREWLDTHDLEYE